jgi:membrane fusion protein (multidrug efflux system)
VRYLWTLIGIVLVLGTLGAVKAAQIGRLISNGKAAEESGPPPEAVAAVRAEEQPWESALHAVGSVASDKGVALSNEVPGLVTRINFESGASVKQGTAIVELDTSTEHAQLASARARKALAVTTDERTRALAASGAVSPSQLDVDDAALRTATKEVDSIQTQIEKKTIRAPFSGRLGIRAVNLGQYLNPGTPVTVLETAEAVHVDFALPQQHLKDIAIGLPVRLALAAEGDKAAALEGKVAAVDPTIAQTTRTIKVRADVPNRDGRLRPGMFVNVAMVLPEAPKYVTAPSTAVVHEPYGDSVFIVEDKKPEAKGLKATPDGKPVKIARQQFVRRGPARGDFVAIVEGLKAGQEVVTAGAFKLRNGAPVVVDNTKVPTPQLAPRPENR